MKLKSLQIFTLIYIVIGPIGYALLSEPQCPTNWYELEQRGIDLHNCITGANVGLGGYIILLIVSGTILVILWLIKYFRWLLKFSTKTNKS